MHVSRKKDQIKHLVCIAKLQERSIRTRPLCTQVDGGDCGWGFRGICSCRAQVALGGYLRVGLLCREDCKDLERLLAMSRGVMRVEKLSAESREEKEDILERACRFVEAG
jgi:hypothetical protein